MQLIWGATRLELHLQAELQIQSNQIVSNPFQGSVLLSYRLRPPVFSGAVAVQGTITAVGFSSS